jgi:hypothetical protein
MSIIDVMTYLAHRSPMMTLNYTHIFDQTLKSKFKELSNPGIRPAGLRLRLLKNNWRGAMRVSWTG